MGADAEQIEAARRQVGSDLPIYEQFLRFIASLARFDLGNSFVSGAPVLAEIGKRLIVTVPLTLMAFIVAVAIAVPLGILLVTVFAVNLRLFPSGGFPSRGWQSAGAAFQALVLPVTTIAIVMSASLIRYVRSATQDVLGSDYLRTARALGATFTEALVRHGIRNGAVPVISVLGIELASTLLGAVVVERVFSLPGLGSMLLLGIEQRDYPNVQGVLFVSTLLVLLIGFAADLLQRFIDPRLRGRAHAA